MLRDTALTGINITKRTKIIPVIGIMVAMLNLAVNLLLIPLIGAMGSAVATIISNLIFFAAVYFIAQRIYPIPYELKKVIMIILVATGLYLVSEFLAGVSLLPRIVLKLCLLGAFPAALYPLGFYDPVEKERLKLMVIRIFRG